MAKEDDDSEGGWRRRTTAISKDYDDNKLKDYGDFEGWRRQNDGFEILRRRRTAKEDGECTFFGCLGVLSSEGLGGWGMDV